MGYESVASRDRETAPAIGLGVQATYMQRVVLLPRMPDPARPLPFGRVRGHDGDRVWVEWLDFPRRIVSSVRAQFLAPACPICRARFLDADETHRHDVDGGPRTLTPRGVRDDPLAPDRRPRLSGGPVVNITTPHDGPRPPFPPGAGMADALRIRNPSINGITAGVTPYDFEQAAAVLREAQRRLR